MPRDPFVMAHVAHVAHQLLGSVSEHPLLPCYHQGQTSSSLPKAPLLQPMEDRQLPKDHNFPARIHAVPGQVEKRLSITYSVAKYAAELLVQGWSLPSLAL